MYTFVKEFKQPTGEGEQINFWIFPYLTFNGWKLSWRLKNLTQTVFKVFLIPKGSWKAIVQKCNLRIVYYHGYETDFLKTTGHYTSKIIVSSKLLLLRKTSNKPSYLNDDKHDLLFEKFSTLREKKWNWMNCQGLEIMKFNDHEKRG